MIDREGFVLAIARALQSGALKSGHLMGHADASMRAQQVADAFPQLFTNVDIALDTVPKRPY